VVPGLSQVAILCTPTNHYMPLALQSARKGAQMLHLSLAVYEVRDITTLNVAFVQIDEESAGWPLGAGGHFSGEPARPHRAVRDREQTALRYTFREHVKAGGLIAYTPNYNDLFRRAASYMDKILRGTKPGELLIEQPTKFLLLINLKTARALGLTVPPRLLVLADELIE
jgi:putative tryptophan/tyrosine transport system substrate-binding protein